MLLMTVLFNAWKILKHRKMAGVRKNEKGAKETTKNK